MNYYLYAFIGIIWIAFWLYWLVSSFSAKKSVRRGTWMYGVLARVIFIIVIFVLTKSFDVKNIAITGNDFVTSLSFQVIGVVMLVSGLAFAVWTRVHLGRNWGMPMSVRENPELVTSGPYRFVRHPIYTGFLFATFGTALAIASIWLYAFIFFAIYFIYSATREEKLLAQQFPDQYPAYKKRTKMLIPFLF